MANHILSKSNFAIELSMIKHRFLNDTSLEVMTYGHINFKIMNLKLGIDHCNKSKEAR